MYVSYHKKAAVFVTKDPYSGNLMYAGPYH